MYSYRIDASGIALFRTVGLLRELEATGSHCPRVHGSRLLDPMSSAAGAVGRSFARRHLGG